MSLVGVFLTWTFHESCRWMPFIGKEFARVVFRSNSSAVALKNYLSMFDLKTHGYLASGIFGVSVLQPLLEQS